MTLERQELVTFERVKTKVEVIYNNGKSEQLSTDFKWEIEQAENDGSTAPKVGDYRKTLYIYEYTHIYIRIYVHIYIFFFFSEVFL